MSALFVDEKWENRQLPISTKMTIMYNI